MSVVLDASAVIAFLKSEPGAEIVAKHLQRSCISTVNLLEVLEKSTRQKQSVDKVVRLLRGWQVEFAPFDEQQVHAATQIKLQVGNADVSLADRACLALGTVRRLPVLTSDRLWSKLKVGIEVIQIRVELD